MRKYQYTIDQLSCADCAAKMEIELNRLPDVHDASIQFLYKTLTFQSNTDDINELIHQMNQTIQSIDADAVIVVGEKLQYELPTLDCAHCAATIEDRLSKLNSIQEVNVDFLAKSLSFVPMNQSSIDTIEQDIQHIIDQVEPGLVMKAKHPNNQKDERFPFKLELTQIVIALLLFGLGYLLGEDHVIYLPLMIMSYLLVGSEVVIKAIKNIFRKNFFDENFLMTIATLGAFGIGTYSEAVAVMLFYQVGELFQSMAVHRSRQSIKSLVALKPQVANQLVKDQTVEVLVDEITPGDLIVIKPGERIPLDSEITSGESLIDTKALTGESLPVFVKAGDIILSGCINLDGVLTAKVLKRASDSTVSKVLEMVEEASSKKASTEKLITKFSRYYTPIVTLAAVLLAIIPPLFIPGQIWSVWLSRAFIFLVISCPCALVISIPLSFFAGIGRASKQGILVKGGNYLEALNDVELIIFDKTGTLTKGQFSVTDVILYDETYSQDQVMEIAAHLESHSTHPLAQSIVHAYQGTLDKQQVTEIKEIAGHGLIGNYNGLSVALGNARLMNQLNVSVEKTSSIGTHIYVAINEQLIGLIVIEDTVKEDAKVSINQLKQAGKRLVMLTGDRKVVADQIGKDLGMDEIYSELLPEDKLTIFEQLIETLEPHQKSMVIGDGINDTPMLARADIAVAMGGLGSDAAIEVSDLVIMNDELKKLPESFHIARKTRRIVWQNIIFALGIKFFFLGLGAFGLTTMWQAVFADVGVSILAILNAFRIFRK